MLTLPARFRRGLSGDAMHGVLAPGSHFRSSGHEWLSRAVERAEKPSWPKQGKGHEARQVDGARFDKADDFIEHPARTELTRREWGEPELRRMLEHVFSDEARRPPAGKTGFDRTRSPIWPGRKPMF